MESPNPVLNPTTSPISSSVELFSTTDDARGGIFSVGARTSNGKIDLNLPRIPVDSIVHLDARTSNAPANVAVSAAYEGSFRLRTSTATPSVKHDRNEDSKDPSGLQRPRSLMLAQNKGSAYGTVFWGAGRSRNQLGNIEIRSSNADVQLDLS